MPERRNNWARIHSRSRTVKRLTGRSGPTILSIGLVGVVWISLPQLETSILSLAPDNLVRVILLTVPLGMLAAFGGSILYGRQACGSTT